MVGPGYAPVPYKLVKIITGRGGKGKLFVYLADLLPYYKINAQEIQAHTFLEGKLLISGITWEKAFTILCISVSFPSCRKELIHIAKRFSHKSWLQCNIAFRKECQLQNARTGLASIQISIILTQLISCIWFHNIFCHSTGRASSVYWQPSVQRAEPLLERPLACCRFLDSSAGPSTHPLPPHHHSQSLSQSKGGFRHC